MAHQRPTNFPVDYLPESIPAYFRWTPRLSKFPHYSVIVRGSTAAGGVTTLHAASCTTCPEQLAAT